MILPLLVFPVLSMPTVTRNPTFFGPNGAIQEGQHQKTMRKFWIIFTHSMCKLDHLSYWGKIVYKYEMVAVIAVLLT